MDFTNRPAQPAAKPSGAGATKGNGAWRGSPMWLKVVWVVLLFSITVLVIAIVALFAFGPKESKFVDEDRVQAVFLDNGQVYFGNIQTVNNSYLDLQNIYYLRVQQSVQPKEGNDQEDANSVVLEKLGCELHGPIDQMIINRDHVTFWENLKTDGQVSEAIKKWVEQNPDGQKCEAASAGAQQ